MSRLILVIVGFFAISQASIIWGPPPLPKPRHISVEKRDPISISDEEWKQIIGNNAPVTERYPGYKKGTVDMSAECGKPGPNNEDRITGGHEATEHEYPWMAAVFMTKGEDRYFCGGTLLTNEWVMTAAHCVHEIDSIEVMLGAHNVRADSEEGRVTLKATRFFTHPDWNSNLIRNDIGLIQLERPVEFNETIRPICLPARSEENEKFAGLDCPASGWGKPNDAATSISPVLREVMTHTITNLVCFFELFQITANNICISGKGGNSTCNGDSGGPLHLEMADGRMKQIGITSFGLVFGCELGLHAAFTRTTSYLQFIETETGLVIDP